MAHGVAKEFQSVDGEDILNLAVDVHRVNPHLRQLGGGEIDALLPVAIAEGTGIGADAGEETFGGVGDDGFAAEGGAHRPKDQLAGARYLRVRDHKVEVFVSRVNVVVKEDSFGFRGFQAVGKHSRTVEGTHIHADD